MARARLQKFRFDQAIALQKRADPNGLSLALTLDRRALTESQTGSHDKAIADYEVALAIRRKRLPLETGVPVVPIAIYGSSRVRNWKRLQFPRVTVQYGEPIRWEPIEHPTREQQQEVADQILVEIRKLYAGLEAHGRKGILRRLRAERGALDGTVAARG